jgi:hypothetical protein
MVARRFEEPLVLVVVGVGSEQSVPPPNLDRRRADSKLRCDLGERQHTGFAEPDEARFETMRPLDPPDAGAMDRTSLDRANPPLVEDPGDLRMGVGMEQAIDLGDHLRARSP